MSTGAMPGDEPLLYFGKLPSRGDFVRCAHLPGLVQTLDDWLSGGLQAMATEPRWRELYDRAPMQHFAFLGSRRAPGLAGHLAASHDASGRRFPFLTAARVETSDPLAFLGRSPLALGRCWSRLGMAARLALLGSDAAPVLAELAQTVVDLPDEGLAHEAALTGFLESQTLDGLAALLAAAGHSLDLRQSLLGLGLLLQPLPGSGAQSLERGLRLPLPADPLLRPLVAALWLDLIAGFLAQGDFELALFMPASIGAGTPPTMALGFDGASPRVLRAALDPDYGREVFIDVREAAWVEAHLGQDYAMFKLSSYLCQGRLTLAQMRRSFTENFLGS